VTIGYVNELEQDVDAVIGATFAAAPGVQINGLPGDTPDGDWFDAKVGLDVALSERAVLTASYSTSLERDDADVTSAQIGLRLSW
jgi:outer membrane autotransporter protein